MNYQATFAVYGKCRETYAKQAVKAFERAEIPLVLEPFGRLPHLQAVSLVRDIALADTEIPELQLSGVFSTAQRAKEFAALARKTASDVTIRAKFRQADADGKYQACKTTPELLRMAGL